jgi:hypothetical protein
MRNLTLALGLSLSAFGDSLAVFLIAISYMIQAPLGAIYQQFLTWQSHACDCPDCC